MDKGIQASNIHIRVGLVNTYMQGRESLIPTGEYPSHHLWGADQLNKKRFSLVIIPTSGHRLVSRIAKWLSHSLRYRFGDLDQEIEIWKRRNEIDIVYVADGNLFWLYLLHIVNVFRPKIVRWMYIPPRAYPWWKLREINNSKFFFKGTDLLLCLTQKAASAYIRKWPWLKTRQMDWGADPSQFLPGDKSGKFFFACGRTNRDYSSLLSQAESINAPIHLVVSKTYLDGCPVPPNVHIGHGTPDIQTDRGISYPMLLSKYFQRAVALLIPLKISSDDSAGMTNLLEGMACGLPIIMTRTGSLDIDIESLGAGLYVEPGDPKGWSNACNWIIENPVRAHFMGNRGREVVEAHFNTKRLGKELSDAFEELFSSS